MRVIVTTPNWTLNGVNTFSVTLVRGLRARGHEVVLLVTGSVWRDDKPLPVPPGLDLQVLPLPAIATWTARWEALRAYLERAAPCIYLPNHDVMHSGISPALSSRVGILGIAHSDDPQHYAHVARLAPWWNAAVGVSEAIVGSIGRLPSADGLRVAHIPYGVEVATEPMARVAADGRAGALRILYAGRLEERQKRVMDLVTIAAALRARGVAFSLTIVGDGPARAALEQRLAHEGLGGAVSLLGTRAMEQMPELYRRHDVFLLPSAFEGLPLALLEAMGQGCVPVVSDIASGVPELVRDGEQGFRITVGDTTAFADRLALLARDVSARTAMATRARDRVDEASFGRETMVRRYESLLADLWNDVSSGRYVRRRHAVVPPPTLDWRMHVRAPLAGWRDRRAGGA